MVGKLVMALLVLCSIAVAVSPSDRASAIKYALRSRSARIRKKAEALAVDYEKYVLSAAEDQARLSQGGSSVLGVRSQKEFKTAVGSMLRNELAAAYSVKDMIEKSEDSAAAGYLRAASAQDPRRNLERFINSRTAPSYGQIIGLDRPSSDSSRDYAVQDSASCPGYESVSGLSAAERLRVAQCVQKHQLELQRRQIAELEDLGFGLQIQ